MADGEIDDGDVNSDVDVPVDVPVATVAMISVGAARELVVSCLVQAGRLSEVRARDVVASAPCRLPETYSVDRARTLTDALEALGCEVQLELSSQDLPDTRDPWGSAIQGHPGVSGHW